MVNLPKKRRRYDGVNYLLGFFRKGFVIVDFGTLTWQSRFFLIHFCFLKFILYGRFVFIYFLR